MKTAFPWRKPRREGLCLALICLAVLTPIYAASSQDVSRLCLTRAVLHARLSITPCVGHAVDRAEFGGRLYSDKAPGISLLAVPAALATGLPSPARWGESRDARLWVVRLAAGGLAFVVLLLAVGRVSEGIRTGTGTMISATLGLGTITGSLAATTFSEVPSAALALGAFLLGWRRRWLASGAVAGAALLVEYQSALVVVVLAAYSAAAGRRALLRYVLGVVPGAAVLGAYDTAAFGSPLHSSYRYVANHFAHRQAKGFFGIGWPNLHSIYLVLVADRGLLLVSPVLVVAAAGLVVLRRTYRREAFVCLSVVAAYLLVEFGYFLPYGGVSPGPRFLVPALPFLAIGIAAVGGRARQLALVLLLPSTIVCTALTLTWARSGAGGWPGGAWGETARLLTGSRGVVHHRLASNVVTYLGIGRPLAAAFVACVAGGALVVAACAGASAGACKPRDGV